MRAFTKLQGIVFKYVYIQCNKHARNRKVPKIAQMILCQKMIKLIEDYEWTLDDKDFSETEGTSLKQNHSDFATIKNEIH